MYKGVATQSSQFSGIGGEKTFSPTIASEFFSNTFNRDSISFFAIGISISFYLRYPWMLNMVTKEMPILPLAGIQDEAEVFDDPFKNYSGFPIN